MRIRTNLFLLSIIFVISIVGIGLVMFHTYLRTNAPTGLNSRASGMIKREIVLGCEKSLVTAPVWIAESKQYFREEAVKVRIKEFDSGKASLAAMLKDRDIDICTVAQTPVMFHSFKRNDFSIIAAMVHSYRDLKVLARRDKGIGDSSGLKGKTVGITKGTTGEFFLVVFLTHAGISHSEVRIIDFKPSELPQALGEGRVDAICTWEPHIMNAKKLLGAEAVPLPSAGIYREDFYFVADKSFIENNAEDLTGFLKAIEKGERFIQEEKGEAINIVSERLKLDRDLAALIWNEFTFGLILDQSVLTSLEDEARWAIREGLTEKKEVPNYLDFIYMDALEKVNPQAVTIVR